ncbi:uncharacterized protein [Palaemon carinicauda]|uniref:uncharacterized protein n=1 Tax=Palaemon carinicauda TaxID=392227 RepID=UPI0035B5BEE6
MTTLRVKGKPYMMMVRPAMLYGLETIRLTKKQVVETGVAEMKMLKFSLGLTRRDKIRYKFSRETAHVNQSGKKAREARLKCSGHVKRRWSGHVKRRWSGHVKRRWSSHVKRRNIEYVEDAKHGATRREEERKA